MTSIEWVRGSDGSKGLSWNAFRAERVTMRKGLKVKVSANHCESVNEACRFCYAGKMNLRHGGLPFKPGHRRDYTFVIDEEKLLEPLHRKKPTRIFVESMSDLFGAWWPTSFIDRSYAVMAASPQHVYINLSKRPERRRAYLNDEETFYRVMEARAHLPGQTWHGGMEGHPPPKWPLPNVIEGTSVSCQEEADEFVPIVLQTNAAWRAVSCEPLLGPIDVSKFMWPVCGWWRGPYRRYDEAKAAGAECGLKPQALVHADRRFLDWVIVGGESGRGARPMHPKWALDICRQCRDAGVEFFFKQWGNWAPDDNVNVELANGGGQPDVAWPDGTIAWGTCEEHGGQGLSLRKLKSKKDAGRLLDGREWNGFPAVYRDSTAARGHQE